MGCLFIMTVTFIGHRKIERAEALKEKVAEIVTDLIVNKNADTFLFGSRGDFNKICYDVVTRLKVQYPHVRRVYVRAEYDYADKFTDYLLDSYESTFFPDKVRGAGVLSYVIRNQVMVDMCDIAVVYCDTNYKPEKTKSGTAMATQYAQKRKKQIINLFPIS